MNVVRSVSTISLCVAFTCIASGQPLHQRIDQHLSAIHAGSAAPLCSDGEFMRRVSLDLTGGLPDSATVRSFLADKAPDKRVKLVKQLLESPAFAQHMAGTFDIMLMERRADKYVKADQWHEYLLTSFKENKPLNTLAREILGSDGSDEAQRAAAKFYLEREVEPNLLTREVGRMFFGMDLQCAQCHDHPNINDYYQSDYYGIFAFVRRNYLFQPDKKKPAVIAEKAEGDAKFKSVFTGDEGDTRPRLPGQLEIDEPTFAKDDAYKVKANPKDKNVRPIPKYSRRAQLAELATSGNNKAFNRNIANRLWALVMGRGLVHPVDHHHSDNPPVHPALLEDLSESLVQMKFDIKAMFLELMQTQAYQRSIDLPAVTPQQASAATTLSENWTKSLETLAQEIKQQQTHVADLERRYAENQTAHGPLVEAEKKATEAVGAATKKKTETTAAYQTAQKEFVAQQELESVLNVSVDKTSQAIALLQNDAELAKALEVLRKRQGDIASAAKQASEKASSADGLRIAAEKTFSDAQAAQVTAAKKLQENSTAGKTLGTGLNDGREVLRQRYTQQSHLKNQLKYLESIQQFAEKTQKQKQLQSDMLAIQSKTNSLLAAKTKLTADLKNAQSQLPGVMQAHQSKTSQLEDVRGTADRVAGAAKLIAESVASATVAFQKLPEDKELGAVTDTLRSRHVQLTSESGALAKQVEQLTAQLGTISAELKRLQESEKAMTAQLVTNQSETTVLGQKATELSTQSQVLAEEIGAAAKSLSLNFSQQFASAVLQPLSPEQLALSMLQVTGEDARLRDSVAAAIEKKTPLKEEEKKDPAKLAARQAEIDKQHQAKRKAVIAKFVKLFGAAAGQPQDDFFATVDQALFFGNGGDLRSWLTPRSGNLTDRAAQLTESAQVAEELYLSILTRMPNDDEVASVAEFLKQEESDRNASIGQIAWALLTSSEFRFHH